MITRHGKPVAQLIPFEAGDDAAVAEAIEKVARLRERSIGARAITGIVSATPPRAGARRDDTP